MVSASSFQVRRNAEIVSYVAYVEAVRSVLDPNPMPPGIYQYSVVVTTPHREMKFTAPTKERHDIWLNVSLFGFFGFDLTADYLRRLCNTC